MLGRAALITRRAVPLSNQTAIQAASFGFFDKISQAFTSQKLVRSLVSYFSILSFTFVLDKSSNPSIFTDPKSPHAQVP